MENRLGQSGFTSRENKEKEIVWTGRRGHCDEGC